MWCLLIVHYKMYKASIQWFLRYFSTEKWHMLVPSDPICFWLRSLMAYGYTSLLYSHFYQGCGYTEQLLTKLWTSCLFFKFGKRLSNLQSKVYEYKASIVHNATNISIKALPFLFLSTRTQAHTCTLPKKNSEKFLISCSDPSIYWWVRASREQHAHCYSVGGTIRISSQSFRHCAFSTHKTPLLPERTAYRNVMLSSQ